MKVYYKMKHNIFLCVKYNDNTNISCKEFDTFKDANDYYFKHIHHKEKEFSTMIPVCKYNPFKETFLWYKLSSKLIKISL